MPLQQRPIQISLLPCQNFQDGSPAATGIFHCPCNSALRTTHSSAQRSRFTRNSDRSPLVHHPVQVSMTRKESLFSPAGQAQPSLLPTENVCAICQHQNTHALARKARKTKTTSTGCACARAATACGNWHGEPWMATTLLGGLAVQAAQSHATSIEGQVPCTQATMHPRRNAGSSEISGEKLPHASTAHCHA